MNLPCNLQKNSCPDVILFCLLKVSLVKLPYGVLSQRNKENPSGLVEHELKKGRCEDKINFSKQKNHLGKKMDKFYISDFDKKSQLHPFLERAVKGERSGVLWKCNRAANYYLWFWNMKEVASMDLGLGTINHPHALRAAVDSRRWGRRLNSEIYCLDALSRFYTAQQRTCCWCFYFYSECQRHLFSLPVCSPHCYSPTCRMFLAQRWYVAVHEIMSSMQQQAHYLKKPSNIDFQVLHFSLPTAVKLKC